MNIENRDFSCTVKRALHLNGSSGTASACNRDLLALNIDPVILQIMHKSLAVSNMAGQSAVVIYDRVDRSDNLCCRRQFIHVFDNLCLARHGDIAAAHFECAHGGNGVCHFLHLDIKSNIHIIQSQPLEAVIIHCRRTRMSDRRTNQCQ